MPQPIDDTLFAHIAAGFSLQGSYQLEGMDFSIPIAYLEQYIATLAATMPAHESLSSLVEDFKGMLQRAALINQLHATWRPGDLRGVPELIAEDVLALDASARLLMPGGWFRHAVVYEFKREGDALLFSIYNSGRGSEYHEQRSSKTQLLICPIKTYCIPDMYAALSLEATKPLALSRFIQALILPQIDSYSSYATRMYTEVFPEIAHIGGELLLVADRIPEHAWTAGQLSGVCSQEVLYQLLRMTFATSRAYERFVFDFKQYALQDYIDILTQTQRLQEPSVRHQLKMAIEDALRSLNQPQVFMDAEKRRESAVLLAYQRDLLFSSAPSSQWSTPAIAIAPNPRIKVASQPTTPLGLMSEFPRAHTVFYDPISVRLGRSLLDDIKLISQRCKELRRTGQHQAVIEQIECLFATLPLPSQLGGAIEGYGAIDSLRKAAVFTTQVYDLQTHYSTACQALYASARLPSQLVTQLCILSVLDCVTTHYPVSPKAVNSLMANDIRRILNYHLNDPYLVTNRPALDNRLQVIKKRYAGEWKAFDDAAYLDYYNGIIDTQPKEKAWLEQQVAGMSWDHARKPAALRSQAIEALYYFSLNYTTFQGLFSSRSVSALVRLFRHQMQLEHCFVNTLRWFSGEKYTRPPASMIKLGFYSLQDERVKIRLNTPSHDHDYRVSDSSILRTKYNLTPKKTCQYALIGDHEVIDHDWQAKPYDNALLLTSLSEDLGNEQLYKRYYLSTTPALVGVQDIEARELFQLRSVPELQMALTMDYFTRHIDKLSSKDMRLYFEANITERLAADLTPGHPILAQLDALVRRQTHHPRMKAEALDLVRLLYWVACAVDFADGGVSGRLLACQQLIARLLETPQDESILAGLHRYQFLTAMARVHINEPFEPLVQLLLTSYFFMQAKRSSEVLDTATLAEIQAVIHVFKRRLSRSSSITTQLVQAAVRSVIGSIDSRYQVKGRYPVFKATSAGRPSYTIDVEQGLVSLGRWVFVPIPLDIVQHPFFKGVDFTSTIVCKQSMDRRVISFVIASHGKFRLIANPNQIEPKYTLQRKWFEAWYELHHLSDGQEDTLGFQTCPIDAPGLPDILRERSCQAWVCCEAHQRLLLTRDNRPIFMYHVASQRFKQIDAAGLGTGFVLCDSRDEGVAALFARVENPSFLVLTLKDQQLNVDFSRYDLTLTGRLLSTGLWQFKQSNREDLLLLGETAIAPGVASLVFSTVDTTHKKRCVLMVQPFINTGLPSKTSEYYQLRQDVSGAVPEKLNDGSQALWLYSHSERMIELPMKNGQPYAEKIRDGLYLAYLYLGTEQPEKAWAVLEDCATRMGGLEGTYDELVFLQWIVEELPYQLEETDEKAVQATQDYVACKLKALSLLTTYQRLGRPIALPFISSDMECVTQKRHARVKAFHTSISSHIEQYYIKYQNLAIHASAPFYLSDAAQKSLLDACSPRYGAMAYQSQALQMAALKQERARLLVRQTEGPLAKADNALLVAIERSVASKVSVLGQQTKREVHWIELKLPERPPDTVNDPLNVSLDTNEALLSAAVDVLSPQMDDAVFFEYLPAYYQIACCHAPASLCQQLLDFCRNTIRATYETPLHRQRKSMTYFCYALYAIAATEPAMSSEEWISLSEHSTYSLAALAYSRKNPPAVPIARFVNEQTRLLTDNLGTEVPDARERLPIVVRRQEVKASLSIVDSLKISANESLVLQVFYDAYQTITDGLQVALDTMPAPKKGQVLSSIELQAGQLRYNALQSLKKLSIGSPLSKDNVCEQLMMNTTRLITDLIDGCHSRRDTLLEEANCGPSDASHALRWQLDLAARKRLPLDIDALFMLYLKADMVLYRQETGLEDGAIATLHQHVSEWIDTSTYLQQAERVQKQLAYVMSLTVGDEKNEAIFNLAQTLCDRNQVDALLQPAQAIIQYHSNLLLRPRQIKALSSLLAPPDANNTHTFQDVVEALMPGQGKTKVVVPVIAKLKANGLNLVVIETLPALLNTTHADLNQTSQRHFHQTAHRFEFSREDDCSSARLEQMYRVLVDIQRSQDYLVTTGDSVQALELKYVEFLFSKPFSQPDLIHEWEQQVLAAKKIVALFRDRADVLMDEVHLVLWLKKRLNYALGGQRPIPTQLIKDCVTLYQLLGDMDVEIDGQKRPFLDAVIQPSLLSKDTFQSYLTRLADATGPLSALLSVYPVEEQLAISLYLKNEGTTIPSCIQTANKTTQDTFALYKIQLNELLAYTAHRRVNVQYGKSQQMSMDSMARSVAIPYRANNQPNEGSQFGSVLESVNYTIQALLIEGLSDEIVRESLRQLQADARQELQQTDDPARTLDDTLVARAFIDMTGDSKKMPAFSAIDVDNEAQFKVVSHALRHNKTLLYDVLKRRILPKMSMDTHVLHSNAYNHVDMYHSCQGTTGSAGNSPTFHQRMQFDAKTDLGNNGFILEVLRAKKSTLSIRGIDFQDTTSFIRQLFFSSDTSFFARVRAIIDISATFQGIDNQTVAAALADYLHQHPDQQIPVLQYVLFYNKNNSLCAYQVGSHQITEIKSTKDEAVIDDQLGCTADARMTFYDNAHAIGADITQADSAMGIALIDEDTTLDAFIQGVMRMRGLQSRQGIALIVPSKWANRTFDEITASMAKTQQNSLSQDVYEAACEKMTNVLRNDLMRRLLDQLSIEEMCRLASVFKPFFVEMPALDLFQTQGSMHRSQPTRFLFEQHKSRQLAQWKQVITTALQPSQRPNFDIEYHALEQQVIAIMDDALPIGEKTYLASTASMGTQVETMKERFKQQQQADNLPMQVKEAYYRSIFAESFWMDYDLSECVKPLQALYDELPGLDVAESPQFSDSLYVSQNFYQCYQGQTQFVGRYQKPVLVLLFRLHPNGRLDCLLVSQQDAKDLMLIVGQSHQPVWFTDTCHTVLRGCRPASILDDARYQALIAQVRFYNGELDGLLDQPGAVNWLQEKPLQKIAFFRRYILPYRGTREQDVEQLQQALLDTTPIYHDLAIRAPGGSVTSIDWRKEYPGLSFSDEDLAQWTALSCAIADANQHWNDGRAPDWQKTYALTPRSLGFIGYYVDELQQLKVLLNELDAYDASLVPVSRVFVAEKHQQVLRRFTGASLDFSSQARLDETSLQALKTLSRLPFLKDHVSLHGIIAKFELPFEPVLRGYDRLLLPSSVTSQLMPRIQSQSLATNASKGLGIQQVMLQFGHECKTTAIATVEQYYARQLGYEPIPLRKDRGRHVMSIRELAKQQGSKQGELLEVGQIGSVFERLGIETERVDFSDNLGLFKEKITASIEAGNVPIAFFTVSRDTGLPTTEGSPEEREHAAIINYYAPETDELEIIHWGQVYSTTATAFYQSSAILPMTRQPEYYEVVPFALRVNPDQKYEKRLREQSRSVSSFIKQSITPRENSGFRCQLIIVKRPTLRNIQRYRRSKLPNDLHDKLSQSTGNLKCYLMTMNPLDFSEKRTILYSDVITQLTHFQQHDVVSSAFEQDCLVSVFQQARQAVECAVFQKDALPLAVYELDAALQKLWPERESHLVPGHYSALINDVDVDGMFLELMQMLAYYQKRPMLRFDEDLSVSAMLSSFSPIGLIDKLTPDVSTQELLQLIAPLSLRVDSLLTVNRFIEHPHADLSVLMALRRVYPLNLILDGSSSGLIEADVAETVALYQGKLIDCITNGKSTASQILELSTELKFYARCGLDQGALIACMLLNPHMNQQVWMNCLSNLRQMSIATAEALIQNPYMTPEGIPLLVKSATEEVIKALLDSSVFSERVSLYQAFLSSYPVLSIKMEAIFSSSLSDSLMYEALIQLRQLIQPNEDLRLNGEIASFSEIKDEDITWLLGKEKKHWIVERLLKNPTITSSAPKLGLVLSMLDKERISGYMSRLREIDDDPNRDESIHELLCAYMDESQLNADEGRGPKI